jgi:DNA polymerase I-like protein with 3'-5' exonuclease and polymerase domains
MVVAPPGHVIVGADYSQIELRLYALLSGDELLLKAFKDLDKYGKLLDPHSLNAAVLFKNDNEDLMGCYYRLKYETPKGKLKYLRTIAKRFVYLVTYGGEESKLYDTMFNERDKITGAKVFKDLTERQVSVWYERWHTLHPWTKSWQLRVGRMVREQGWVAEGGHFRKRFFPGGPSKKNAPPNHTVQGRAAAIMNDAVMRIDEEIPHGKWSRWSGIFLQVHDYVGLYVPESRADETIEIIDRCMKTEIDGLPVIPDTPLATWDWAAQG